MLDIQKLESIKLSPRPRFQRGVGWGLLTPNYKLPPRVDIRLDGFDRVPSGNVIYAMNHTDRYNYWPMQYAQWRQADRYTATWVKGKYYEHWLMGLFMEWANNIPTVSRGYIISRDFLSTVGRRPTNPEYEVLRRLVRGEDVNRTRIPREVLERPRSILGLNFDPTNMSYADAVGGVFETMMRLFVAHNADAKAKGLDLVIFPQGTRSKRLSQGHIGLAQIALHLEWTIVPVGCNGSDSVYRGSSPWGKGGVITYRFGEPISFQEMSPWHTGKPFEPFTRATETRHKAKFQGLVDEVMSRINNLLDPEYQFGERKASDGVRGTTRFV